MSSPCSDSIFKDSSSKTVAHGQRCTMAFHARVSTTVVVPRSLYKYYTFLVVEWISGCILGKASRQTRVCLLLFVKLGVAWAQRCQLAVVTQTKYRIDAVQLRCLPSLEYVARRMESPCLYQHRGYHSYDVLRVCWLLCVFGARYFVSPFRTPARWAAVACCLEMTNVLNNGPKKLPSGRR